MHIGIKRLNPKWLDHKVGNPGTGRLFYSIEEADEYVENAIHYIIEIVEQLNYWLTPQMQELAFGKPGSEGDAGVIEHMANRLIGTYEGFMDWAIDLRSARPPPPPVETLPTGR